MNARQKLHQLHLQEWTIRIADQKASGLTVRQWCEQNNLSFHTYSLYLTPSSFSVADLPPGSKDFSGKAMDSYSFTNA